MIIIQRTHGNAVRIRELLKNNSSQFESILIIENKEISKGFGSNKKNAEKDASRLACEKLELK